MFLPHAPSGSPVLACELDTACAPATCELCLAELPPDEIENSDAQDYVRHYCGPDCFEQWRLRDHPSAQAEAGQAEAGGSEPG